MSIALLQEELTCIGFKKQAALQTALVAADCWTLHQTNGEPPFPKLVNDTDRDDFGKGIWATQLFKNRADFSWNWNARITSENAAMVAAFGLGVADKSAAGTGYTYTCTPLDVVTDGIEMPSTTIVNAIRQGASDIYDIANIGACCEEFGLSFKSGTGRETAMMTSTWVGCGKWANPSTITIPAATAEHELPIGSTTVLTIRTVNYLTAKSIVSADLTWKNNIDLERGFYPGSGSLSGYSLRGRMLRGKPVCEFKFRAFFENGSTELTDFLAQTEGTAAITVVGDVFDSTQHHTLDIDLHRIVFRDFAVVAEGDFVAVDVGCEVMEHNSNGVITITVTNEQNNILVAAS
jgi:hypothetical protein